MPATLAAVVAGAAVGSGRGLLLATEKAKKAALLCVMASAGWIQEASFGSGGRSSAVPAAAKPANGGFQVPDGDMFVEAEEGAWVPGNRCLVRHPFGLSSGCATQH